MASTLTTLRIACRFHKAVDTLTENEDSSFTDMKLILERFKDFSPENLVELTRMVVNERNAVSQVVKPYKECSVGVALLACQAVRNAVARRAASGEVPWLTFRGGAGLAYTVLLDRVPLRIQPDVPEIRDVLPEERLALGLCLQGQLFPDDTSPNAVLRLEVAQKPGRPVDEVFIYLFDPHTGATLDRALVYEGSTGAYFDTAPLAASADDADTTNVYQFKKPSNDVKKDDEGK
jgi:hypothetical protein